MSDSDVDNSSSHFGSSELPQWAIWSVFVFIQLVNIYYRKVLYILLYVSLD